MPGYNGTGPMGQGPMTGRGLGPCGNGMQRGFGRGGGFGRGFGGGMCWRGFGFRNSANVSLTKEEEKKILEAELKEIESEKAEIQKRMKEL